MYTDEFGEVVGLDEVQLMKDELSGRTELLTGLLRQNDLYLAYQCGLILAAWGISEGVDYLEYLVETRIDKTAEFESHRLWGEDNVYDVIAEALEIAASVNNYDRFLIIRVLKKIIFLYGECFFESKLKQALINLNEQSLLPDIKQAMNLALDSERYYQASQLLPVLAKYDKVYAFAQVATFQNLIVKDKRIQYNLEEMQTIV
ncbi:MAG TPA: hypothetical protein VF690_21590 [Hymenobacter sp.]